MANKRIQDLPAKGATIAANDILEVSEYQSPGVYTSKKILGSELGGVTTFTGLTDTPASYTGQTLKFVRVNAGETGLEFATVSVSDTNIANTQLTLPTGTRKLIWGGANSTDILAFRNSTDTASLLEIKGNGSFLLGSSTSYKIQFDATSPSLVGYNAGGGKVWQLSHWSNENSWLVNSGSYQTLIGIGTPTPQDKLHVNVDDTNRTPLRLSVRASNPSDESIGIKFQTTWAGSVFGADACNIIVRTKGTASPVAQKTTTEFYMNSGGTSAIRAMLTSQSNFILQNLTEDTNDIGVVYMANGTAPTAGLIDGYKQYAKDIPPGNSAPHFLTEVGDVIKLYKQSSAGITTVADLVTVLTNLGLLG